MSKIYSKPGRGNEKFLYDSSGKVIGRGVTDKNGKTIYSGAGGYIGKSYQTGHGTVKHYDSDNNYVGGGIKRSNVTTIVCDDNVKTSPPSLPTDSCGKPKPAGEGCFLIVCYLVIIGAVLLLLRTLAS